MKIYKARIKVEAYVDIVVSAPTLTEAKLYLENKNDWMKCESFKELTCRGKTVDDVTEIKRPEDSPWDSDCIPWNSDSGEATVSEVLYEQSHKYPVETDDDEEAERMWSEWFDACKEYSKEFDKRRESQF